MDEWTTLVKKAQKGDRNAFDGLVKRFQDYAVGVAYTRSGDFGEAEDAAQEGFLEAYRRLHTLTEPFAFPTWLRLIVLKFCDRKTRRAVLQTVSLDAAALISCSASNPLIAVICEERRTLVHRAIAPAYRFLEMIEAEKSQPICTISPHPDFVHLPSPKIRERGADAEGVQSLSFPIADIIHV